MNYYFIVNPISGCGRGKKVWGAVEEELKRRRQPYQAFVLQKKGDARRIAGRLSEEAEPCTVAIVGGDGTINEFLDGLTRWGHITLGCIPTGSGNDFVRGLSLTRDPLQALETILRPEEIGKLKLGMVHAGQNRHAFIVSSGIGFDADVCNGAYSSGIKNVLNFFRAGKLVYLATALKLLASMKQYPMKLTLDNGNVLAFPNTFFAAVMNLPYEGGGFYFAPKAEPQSDVFQVCVAEQLNRRRILAILPLALVGRHVGKKGIHILTCKKLEVQAGAPLCVHTDGEIFGFYENATFESAPERLAVILR